MAEENKIYVTEEGLKKLQDEYDNLVHVVREEVKAELAEARSQGDLSENADYDAAREKQAEVEHRTRLISDVVTGQIDVRDVVIPEYTPEDDTEIDVADTPDDTEEVAEDAE